MNFLLQNMNLVTRKIHGKVLLAVLHCGMSVWVAVKISECVRVCERVRVMEFFDFSFRVSNTRFPLSLLVVLGHL